MNVDQDQPDDSDRAKDNRGLVETIEALYLPLLETLAAELRESYPGLSFNVHSLPYGSKTLYQGHNIGLECVFSEQPLNETDSICLQISLCHLTTRPRVMADVAWGHPSGHAEASLTDAWITNEDWPEATPSTLSWLAEAFAGLCQVFKEAVHRGYPSHK